jgi:hypothetical protein
VHFDATKGAIKAHNNLKIHPKSIRESIQNFCLYITENLLDTP